VQTSSNAAAISAVATRRARVALVVGLIAVAGAVGAVLSRSPLTVTGTNSVPAPNTPGFIAGNSSLCVTGGTVPQGTEAIRIPFSANAGPKIGVKLLSGSRVAATGAQAAGWGIDDTVTVPVTRVAQRTRNTRVCMSIGPVSPNLSVDATASPAAASAGHVPGSQELHLEYLGPATTSWWSLTPSIARHLGLGHAAAGTWSALLVLVLMLAVSLLTAWLSFRGTVAPGKIPTAAKICALVACLNAVAWSIITPPFQVPDESSHFAYTQQLAENQQLPTSTSIEYSQEEEIALRDLHWSEVQRHPGNHTIFASAAQQQLQKDLDQNLSRRGGGGVGVSASEPPLYYVLQIIPYELGSPGTLLDQLELMRLLSALMAGLTALFAFLFIRETLPGVPWAWTVGGLGVALAPLLGFMSGGVSPDSMLFAVCAAVFYCLSRAFRSGLTQQLAIAIGVLTAVGLLTKLSFIGLAPGVILGLFGATVRVPRANRRQASRALRLALAIAAIPVCVYIFADLLSSQPRLGILSTASQIVGEGRSIIGAVSYIWQFYLPRVPGMANLFPGISLPRQVWFDRSVGLYGWLDTSFPLWVDSVALVLAGLIGLLCARTLIAGRIAVKQRSAELVAYGAMGVGLAILIAASNYVNPAEALSYAEPRYLLPLLPLLGVALALAARGAGRRWGPSVGVLIIVLVLAHDIFSQMLVVSRYYA
jgi:hypothetical protein